MNASTVTHCFLYIFSWFSPINAGRLCQGGAELSFDRHLAVCNVGLPFEKPTGPIQIAGPGGFTEKGGRPWRQKCRKDISRQRIDLSPSAPGMDSGRRGGVAAVVSFAAPKCGRKRLGVANNCQKAISWWNQEVKDAIQTKKVAYQAWFQKKAESFFMHGTLRRKRTQSSWWKSLKCNLGNVSTMN